MTNFFTNRVLFGVIFFPKSCLKVLGAAYTRVRLIHESLRYFPWIHPQHSVKLSQQLFAETYLYSCVERSNLGCINKLHCVFRTFEETAYLIRPVQGWFLIAQPQKRSKSSTIKQPGCKTEEVHQTREATWLWNQHDHGNKCLVKIRTTKTKLKLSCLTMHATLICPPITLICFVVLPQHFADTHSHLTVIWQHESKESCPKPQGPQL